MFLKVPVSEHQALLPLPDLLRAEGITVIELNGWKENEQGYYWTGVDNRHHGYLGKPNGWVWHHTASGGYTPYVKNSVGQTKACIFAGLWRGESSNRLYQAGGDPVLVFCSGGPADYSQGSGVRAVLVQVSNDQRFYGPQRHSDDYPKWYGNRYYGATEIVHRGDGSPLDQGVFRMVYTAQSVMSELFDWSPWRHIGHLDHTRRKIDPRFEQGSPYTIGFMQDAAQGYAAGIIVLPPEGEMKLEELPPFAGYNSSGFGHLKPAVKVMQRELSGQGHPDKRSIDKTPCRADGYHGPGSQEALNGYKAINGQVTDGWCRDETWRALLHAVN